MDLSNEFLEWFFVSGEIDVFNCPYCDEDLNPLTKTITAKSNRGRKECQRSLIIGRNPKSSEKFIVAKKRI